MAILGWIVFGLVIGFIARFLMPGPQPMGLIMTALLGVAGSFVGGYLGYLLHGGGEALASPTPAKWIGSILGAVLLLFVYGLLRRKA